MATKNIDVLVVGLVNPRYVERLDQNFRTHKLWLAEDKDAFLREVGPKIRGLATSGNPVMGASKALIDQLPKLEIIASSGVGYDPIDIGAAKARGVIVTNTPGVLNDCVADLGLTMLLSVARRVCEADRYVRAGKWKSQGRFPMATKVGGKVCGIVGLGNIGQAVAKRAAAFDMNIHYYDPFPKPGCTYTRHESIAELAKHSDFLVLTLPGGKETQRVINADILRALGSKGFLISMSRGSVVDEKALVAALKDGTIAGAGMDVYDSEPNVPEELFSMDNVVILPHIASSTNETFAAMGDLAYDNIYAHFTGKPVLTRVV